MKHGIGAGAIMPTLAACGAEIGDKAVAADAADDPSTALSGEAGFATAASCFAKLEAVPRLYAALASPRSGAEQAELNQSSSDRGADSARYERLAGRIGGEIGRSTGEIEATLREAQEAVDLERAARPFDEFAIWVGGEAHQCPPPVEG